MTLNQILSQIKEKKFAPVYYLHGEETWFIDKIMDALDADGAVMTASEASFNRTLLYGAETQAAQMVQACRSFPVMAQYRLVLVKEAQRVNKAEWEKMKAYFENPVPSTVLVLAFRDRNAGLPKASVTALGKKGGVNFHAKKLYEKDVQHWIAGQIKDSDFEADPQIPFILSANLGTDIAHIENELEKMFIFLKAHNKKELKQDFVYQMIQVDKRFNVFELVHAIAGRENYKAHMIVDRLTQNEKINPPILTINGLFRFFHNLALVHRFQLRTTDSIKNQLKVNYYQAKDYQLASRNFNLAQTYRNISFLKEVDLSMKGMLSTHLSSRELVKTLVWKMLN
ncbi:MAG: DNA polymerase III subunit delta [Bacteroidota bacterium]